MCPVTEVADQEEAGVGQEDETRKVEEDLQDDLELSDQDADQVHGGDLGLKLGKPPAPLPIPYPV